MKIRRVNENDAIELIKLILLADNRNLDVASKKVKKFLKSDKGFFIIAIKNNKILGYLLFTITEEDENASRFLDTSKFSCVCWIAVHPNFRSKNIGTKLLRESEKYAEKYKKLGVWLDCRKGVVKFYEKNGFRKVGTYDKETSSGQLKPCYIMIKKTK